MFLKNVFVRETKKAIEKTPIARSFIIGKVFSFLNIEKVIEKAGIKKRSGISAKNVAFIYSLFGVSDAKSIVGLAEQVKEDKLLKNIIESNLDKININNKVLTNFVDGLNIEKSVRANEEIIKVMQTNQITKADVDGVIIGDDTNLKKTGKHMENIAIIYDHGDGTYGRGYSVVTTHYADDRKHYPLLFGFRLKSEDEKKDDEMKKLKNKLGIDNRSSKDLLKLVNHQIANKNAPKVVVLPGSSFNLSTIKELKKRGVPWIGVSNKNRNYTVSNNVKKAKKIMRDVKESEYLLLKDDGHNKAAITKGEMAGLGKVNLIVVNNIDEDTTKLYVTDDIEYKKSIEYLTTVINQENREDETKVKLMLEQLARIRKCGITTENFVADRWYYVPWFINKVLLLGFRRVVTKTKKNMLYLFNGIECDVDEIKSMISDEEYKHYEQQNILMTSRIVHQRGIGNVKIVFVKELNAKGKVMQEYSLMCTDTTCEDVKVFWIDKIRWVIETFYREAKQNHGMNDFHMQKFTGIYAHMLFVFISFIFFTLLQLLVPGLLEKTLGWIKRNYVNAAVQIRKINGKILVIFHHEFLRKYGLMQDDLSRE